ncbi:hypothetical protein Tco_0307076 [Tanacetum coccineum]
MSKEVGTPRYLNLVVPLKKVGDEAVHKELGDIIERVATTASSLEAEQDNTILGDMDAQTRFETTSKWSNDPPLSRGYTLRSGKAVGIYCGIDGTFSYQCASVKFMLQTILVLPVQVNAAEVMGFMRLLIFWSTAKAKTVNGERQIQALIDKKKVIITETSIRSNLHLEDAGGTEYAKSTAWNEFSSTLASLIICLAINQNFNLQVTLFDAMVKQLRWRLKFPDTPITTQPSSSRSQKKQSKRKQRKDTAVTQEETQQDDSVPIPSNNPPLRGEDSMQLSELMLLCTNLQKQVHDLEKVNDAQAKEIADLKKKVQKLERKKKSRTTGLKRLKKVGMSRRVESSKDKESLGDHEDASKQGRSIEDIDKDADVSLVDDTRGIGEKQEQSAKVREVNTNVKGSTAPTTIKEITLAQTLIQIKAAKPKVVTTATTTTRTTRPKARGVVQKKILGKKRAGKEQQQESSKRQRMEDDKETYEHEKVEVDDEAKLKIHMVIVKDDDIAVDAIPLATKPPVIVEYKIIKKGIIGHYQLIRADGSSKRYSSMIRMLQGIDREDLETLWR